MYTHTNYRTKKAVKEAVLAGQVVTIFQPGGYFYPPEANPGYTGQAFLEGPHYPEPHKWYARVDVKDGQVVKVY